MGATRGYSRVPEGFWGTREYSRAHLGRAVRPAQHLAHVGVGAAARAHLGRRLRVRHEVAQRADRHEVHLVGPKGWYYSRVLKGTPRVPRMCPNRGRASESAGKKLT